MKNKHDVIVVLFLLKSSYFFVSIVYFETTEYMRLLVRFFNIHITHAGSWKLASLFTAHRQEKLQETVLSSVVHPS
jgi:hypothetical protein